MLWSLKKQCLEHLEDLSEEDSTSGGSKVVFKVRFDNILDERVHILETSEILKHLNRPIGFNSRDASQLHEQGVDMDDLRVDVVCC